ncbi:MAG: lycopene cyclase domain-containing protein [Nocardioidaceae bacterium]|nr:lycopene cyclase domain-containing protein [Nocardioidaceae bacterium]
MTGGPTYLLVLTGCLLITCPLELLGARVYRRPGRLVAVLVPVVVTFLLWDVLGVSLGHWSFPGVGLSGLVLPGDLPIEELAFFLVVPTCALLTWEGVGLVLGWSRRSRSGGAP